jgi:ribosomal 50S subunit-recycling heat shock protein
MDRMRIDKWLWAARFFKTRALAVEEIGKGRIQLNGQDKLKVLPADKEAFMALAQRLEAIRQLLKHLSDTAIKPETLKTS